MRLASGSTLPTRRRSRRACRRSAAISPSSWSEPSRTSCSMRSSASRVWRPRSGRSSAASPRARQQGEPRRRRRARARGKGAWGGPCCRSTASTRAALPMPRGPPAGDRPLGRAHRLGRPVPRPHREELADVTRADALAHPTWRMGPKITVDSATLANKGLELIEAHFLFGLPYERIEVVVHPTSVVHALARFRDGAAIAHLGLPGHAGPDLVRADLSRARGTPVEPLDFADGLDAGVRAPRPRDVPAARSRAPGRRVGRHVSRAPSTRRTRSPSPRSSPGGCRSSGSQASSRRPSRGRRGAGTGSRRAHRGRCRGAPPRRASSGALVA